jgi:predicted GIY-YIG superfamily endonuclease
MHYVYLIQSIGSPGQRYVGYTDDLKCRMADHYAGRSIHTANHRPWQLVGYIALASATKAREFERYLKVGSGHAFARRHFWPVAYVK